MVQIRGTITPSTGVWEALPDDVQEWLTNIANDCVVMLSRNDVEGALAHIKEHELDADMHVALNTRFDSKQRAAMKKAIFGWRV